MVGVDDLWIAPRDPRKETASASFHGKGGRNWGTRIEIAPYREHRFYKGTLAKFCWDRHLNVR